MASKIGSVEDLSLVTDWAAECLSDMIEKLPNECIVLCDASIEFLLSRIRVSRAYRERKNLIYDIIGCECDPSYHVLALCGPDIEIVKTVCDLQVASASIVCVPVVMREVEIYVEMASRQNKNLSCKALNLGFVPLGVSMIQLPLSGFLMQTIQEDGALLSSAARALTDLQLLCGPIPNVRVHGKNAQLVFNMSREFQVTVGASSFPKTNVFANLVVIDRMVDPVTPLLPQTSIEGIVDEYFGSSFGFTQIPEQLQRSTGSAWKEKTWNMYPRSKTGLSQRDELYRSIRHMFIDEATEALCEVGAMVAKGSSGEDQATASCGFKFAWKTADGVMRAIGMVNQLLNAIIDRDEEFASYVSVKEAINAGVMQRRWDDYYSLVEKLMYEKECYLLAAQLMLLRCGVDDGIAQDKLDMFRTEIVYHYGFQEAETLRILENRQLLCRRRRGTSWSKLRSKLKLDELSDGGKKKRTDYVPLSVRVVQRDLMGDDTIDDLLCDECSHKEGAMGRDKATLVYFVGGVTRREIACLKWIAKHEMKWGGHIVIMATEILTAEKYVKACMPFLSDHPSMWEMSKSRM